MNATGLDVFERSAQAAHIWLNEISDHIGPDRKLAWHVLARCCVRHCLKRSEPFGRRRRAPAMSQRKG